MHSTRCFGLGLLILVAVSSVSAGWQPLPMAQPYVSAAVTDSSGQRIILAASGAGIWQSADGGSNWLPVSPRFLTGGRIDGLKLDALDAGADTLLAQIEKTSPVSSRFLRNLYSLNGGQSWNEFTHDSVQSTGQVSISRHAHQVWFHIRQNVLRRSTDYGQTWPVTVTIPSLNDDNSTLEHFYQDPLHDSTLFFTGNYLYNPDDSTAVGGLVRSDDLGLTWRTVIDIHGRFGMDNAGVENVVRLSNGNLMIISWSIPGTILQSTDEGLNWTPITGLPEDLFATRIVEDPAHAGRLFMTASSHGGLMRSDDFGQSWTDSLAGLPNRWTLATSFYQNPVSGQIILLSGDNENLQSTDHGDSWTALPLPAVGARCEFSFTSQALFADAVKNEGGWGRHYALSPQPASWRELTLPQSDRNHFRQISRIFYKNADTLAAFITQTGPVRDSTMSGILHSTDNGGTWTLSSPLATELSGTLLNFGMVDTVPHLAVATVTQDTIYFSSDLGRTWNFPYEIPINEFATEMIQNRQALYLLTSDYMGNGSAIYRSPNFDQSFDGITPVGHGFYHMVLQGDDLMVALGERALLYRHSTWTVQATMPFAHRTTDWEWISIPDTLHRLVAMIDDSSKLWLSDDLGMSWQSRNMDLPFAEQNVRFSGLTCDTVNQRLWVSTGLGACYLNFDELVFSDAPLVLKPADLHLLTVYPNPFNNETRIRYSVERPGMIRLDLYNLTGQRVRTITDRFRDAGSYELHLNSDGLASGTYFVRFTSPTTIRTTKILVLK